MFLYTHTKAAFDQKQLKKEMAKYFPILNILHVIYPSPCDGKSDFSAAIILEIQRKQYCEYYYNLKLYLLYLNISYITIYLFISIYLSHIPVIVKLNFQQP